jgi:adenylate cyclase
MARTVAIRRVDAAAAVILAVTAGALVPLVPLAVGVAVAAGLLALWLVTAMVLFGGGVWLSMAIPVAAVVPPLAAAGFARHLHERRLAARARRGVTALQRFHAPALARRLADNPDYLASPRTRRLSILFVDLAGFTGLSEALGLEGTRALVETFHRRTADVISRHDGLVLNYLGDGLLAVFGLPDVGPDDPDRALAAALALVDAVRAIAPPAPEAVMDARVGLHADDVVVSRLGHETHQQVTVTGDGVNLASRLMEVAKDAGGSIAASSALMGSLSGPPPAPPTSVVTAAIRGRRARAEVALWQLPRR